MAISKMRIRGAPAADSAPHDAPVRRSARLRVDRVSNDYPDQGDQPDFAYVQLLAYPKEGDPVLWTSDSGNVLTVYCKALMRAGGVAFLVTGVDHA